MSIVTNLIVHIICFLVLTVICFGITIRNHGEKRHTLMRRFLVSAMLVVIFSGLNRYVVDNLNHFGFQVIYHIKMVYGFSIVFMYSKIYSMAVSWGLKRNRITISMLNIGAILTLITITLMIAFATQDLFLYMENGVMTEGPLYHLWYVCQSLIVGVVILTVIMTMSDPNYAVYRKNVLPFVIFSILTILLFVIQAITNNSIVSVVGCTVWVIYLFFYSNRVDVFKDEFTGIDNNIQMFRDIDEAIGESLHFCLWIFDADSVEVVGKFYGAGERDIAIKTVSKVVLQTAINEGGYAYRYSDTEFGIIRNLESQWNYYALEDDINGILDEKTRTGEIPYKLSVKCGKAIFDQDKHITAHDIIAEAVKDKADSEGFLWE